MFKHHIRAVLFDLDGVVVFTDRFHELGWRKLAEDNGWEFSPELAHSLRGVSRMEALEVILEKNGKEAATDEQKQAWAEVKNNYYLEAVQGIDNSDVLPGSLEFIQELRDRDIKIALCSASKNAPKILELLNIGDLFDEIVCGLDVSRSKPDPQVFELAAERLGIPNFHCLVFEDAPSGVEGARRAGMKCVGIGDAAGLPEAPAVVSEFSEIDMDALLDSARPYRPEPHEWCLVEGQFRSSRSHYWESMLAVTNGVLGVRGNLEEVTEGVATYPATFVNGVVGYTDYHYMWKFSGFPERGHCIRNICEWTRVELVVDGERFDMNQAGLTEHRRWLDMATGSAHREFVWSTKSGVEVKVTTRRLASMVRREVAALEYSVSVSKACEVRLETISEGEPNSGHFPEAGIKCAGWEKQGDLEIGQLESATSGQKMAVAQSVQVDGELQTAVNEGAVSRVEVIRSFDAAGSFVLSKRIAITSDLERSDADLVPAAQSALTDAPAIEALFQEQADFWQEYWKLADIQIEGDQLDQLGVRLSLYHNRQSLPEDGVRSVSANGQSGDNYGGHIFWDTEMYVLQPVLHTEPKCARGTLEYRYGILDKAREQARRMQGKGALYSWNSITGEECAHVYEASTAEYHLQSAIAWAVVRYVDATDDTAFMHDMGAEMIFETARFLRDRGTFVAHKGDRFCINVVCGPNEYSCGVDNNAYTNYLAQWHLLRAADIFVEMQKQAPEKLAQLAERIGVDLAEIDSWRDAGERMYLPWDEKLGIIPQDDQFLGRDPVDMSKIPLHTDIRSLVHPLNLWRMQLVKQADTVLLLFLFRHLFDEETVRKTYEFHEPKTNHGSSLSACMHSVVANDIGKSEDAYHFFRETALMDINDLKSNTSGGVHSACLGGTWMAVVNGFGGYRDSPEGLLLNPKLPKQWSRLSFPLVWRGRHLRIECSSEATSVHLLSGPDLSFLLGTESISLTTGEEYKKTHE